MAGFVETYRGTIYPWHCDHLGHLTVMHYVGFFDQAGWQLLSALGFGRARLEAEGRGFVDVKATIEYRAEQHAGGLIHIESGLTRIGTTSVTARHQMRNSESGALAATMEIVGLYFDLEAREKVPLPAADKARLGGFLVEPDAG
jgi:acyl-CoA thioester hydrolase